MKPPSDPITVVFDRDEAIALTEEGSHFSDGIRIRGRQRIREGLGTESLHRAADAHRRSRRWDDHGT